jgi:hypothetical protein
MEFELTEISERIIHPLNIDSAKVAIANGMKLEKQTTYTGVTVNIFRIKSLQSYFKVNN